MTTMVDFLPGSYRGGTVRREAMRERLLLAIPVVLALVAVDVVLRIRTAGVRAMAHNAREHAQFGAHLGEEAKTLTERAAELQKAIDELARPLAGQRMTQILDELLAGRPAGIGLHELVVHQTPWTPDSLPVLTVGASCATADELKDYLALVRSSEVLPPMQCQRTDQARDDAAFVFLLENKVARRAR